MDKIIGMGNALVDVLVKIDDDSLLGKLHLPKGSMQLIQEATLSEIRKYKEDFGKLIELISDEDAASLMPEADDEELDVVIDAAIDRVLSSMA